MRILRASAHGWRNLEPLQLALDGGGAAGGLVVLHGDNGQGKTNIIEALYYLAAFRSLRTTQTVDLVRHGEREARIALDLETGPVVRHIEARLAPRTGGRGTIVGRSVLVDGKTVRKISDAFGLLAVVLFVPEDLLLVRAAPAARRRFLDMAASVVERPYLVELATFQRVLKSRNALFAGGRVPSPTLLDTYDEQLARAGARVVLRRRALVRAVGPNVDRLFRVLHGDLPVTLAYESADVVAGVEGEDALTAALLAGLGAARPVDVRRGHTTFGPQTDDLQIALGGRPAREHASQGQLRSLVLAMKLAELAHLEERLGEPPVLLLDDVPSELDPARRK